MKMANEPDPRVGWVDVLPAMSLGWDLALPICIGVLVGLWLDRRLGTGYLITLGLLLFGAAVGVYNVLRFARRLDVQEQEKRKGQQHTSQ